MKVKNISATIIDIPEFKLFLNPGDIGDLSKFDPKEIHKHKLLTAYFEKGLLANLGNTTVRGSSAALKTARERIEKLGLKDYKEQPSSKKQNSTREKINQVKNQKTLKSDVNTERYADQYYNNLNPSNPQTEEKVPRPKIQEQFQSVQINYDGIVGNFGSYGKIASEQLTGKTTQLNPEINKVPSNKLQDNIIIKDIEGNEYNVSLEKITERLKRKCLGFTSNGKPCKKWAVLNFNSCMTHMSKSEKELYEKLKKEGKLEELKGYL